MDTRFLDQHVALVTGASRGIGRGIAVRLASFGCNLLLTARHAEALTETAKMCEKHSVQAKIFATDIRNKTSVQDMLTYCVRELGGIDIGIVNQGINKGGLFAEDKNDEWENVIDTNLKASMAITRQILPYLQKVSNEKKRALIFIASMAAKFSSAKIAAYHASKFGLLGFSHSIFEEVREQGIKVSAICPGMVNTDMIRKRDINIDKTLQVDDVADAVSYILQSSDTACPVEILLRPQRSPNT